jgi:hypothetical protein
MAGTRKSGDEALLVALACGATVTSAARSAGISVRTAHRRLGQAGFQERLREMRRDMLQRAADMLTAMALDSTKKLHSLQDENVPPGVRLGAIRTIFEFSLRMREQSELAERLTALEAKFP